MQMAATQVKRAVDHETAELIAEEVRRLLTLMGIEPARVSTGRDSNERLTLSIEAGEAGRALIGTHGATLDALQHLIRCVVSRRLHHAVAVGVDVNHYRAQRERALTHLAEEAARKTQRTGQAAVLEVMSAADRRTIHCALAENKRVQTESVGEEPNRRIIVKPVFL